MLEPKEMWDSFTVLGFANQYKIGFPGVAAGLGTSHKIGNRLSKATMSYGHGIAIFTLCS